MILKIAVENGTGKTSLLQAIEWCICGELPYMETREFKREDAIVNAFDDERLAKVTLTLRSNNGRALKITREKKTKIYNSR